MAWFAVQTQRFLWLRQHKRRAHTQEQAAIRANETVAWLCLETKGIYCFCISHKMQLSPLDPLPESTQDGDGEDNVPQLGFMVRNHCHIISQSQLCMHSDLLERCCWFSGRLRREFSVAQRRHEIIMSNGRDCHISSVFIKQFFHSPPLSSSSTGVGLDLWMKEKNYSHIA